MTTYDLRRLSPQSFERMVRALAFAQMGSSGTVFAPGPDGARDFICEGSIPGFEGKGWDGYLVIQCKYREKLEGTKKDIDWLRQQIEGELKKFKDTKRRLRRPDYYILATNLPLSGTDGVTRKGERKQGGYSLVSSFFDEWKSEIGLRDFHIWSHDIIIDLLANHQDIRAAFSAFITSGDVLSAAFAKFNARDEKFPSIISRALRTRTFTDQYVPLNEAGSVDPKKIATSKVFIDLPVCLERSQKSRLERKPSWFVENIISWSKYKLDFDSTFGNALAIEGSIRVSNTIILLGGPGQGKSTTGLFVAQLFRTAILMDDVAAKSDPRVRDVIPEIIRRAKEQNLSIDLPRRFPIHLSLPMYADRISDTKHRQEGAPSLLSHIAYMIGRDADDEVNRDDLRAWLKVYPWLVILDGLDEVPASGERSAVIEAINGFLSEIAGAEADVMVIVTSRPQGYNNDLDERYWARWQLADLDPELAVKYAEALSLAQYPLDRDRRNRTLSALKRAMEHPATARLMVSPLQVTILHIIIDGGGSAPVGRWALFNEYFQILKKREKAKGGPIQAVLEKNWDHIDPVHYQAGLVLQTESEAAGAAGAHFTLKREDSGEAAHRFRS